MLAVPAARGVRHPAGGRVAHFRALDRTLPVGAGGGACDGLFRPVLSGSSMGRIQRLITHKPTDWCVVLPGMYAP